jgi:FKBP-type peptidyl-prolyl cis-trans isomerase FkpA
MSVRWFGAALCAALIACGGGASGPAPKAPVPIDSIAFAPSLDIDLSKFTRTKAGAWYRDFVIGPGPVAALERTLIMKYAVSLPNGTVIETQSVPVEIVLDTKTLRGFRDALPGMRAGGSRTIILPPELAYGRVAQERIPANSTLVFEIELLAVR